MKIYFAGSIRGGREDKELYAEIINLLKKYGEVLTEHIGDKTLSELGEDGPDDYYIFERDMEWLKQADIIVAEVTTPSLGIGYELGKAKEMKIPVLCLYRKNANKKLSAMISGNRYFQVVEYSDLKNVEEVLQNYFEH